MSDSGRPPSETTPPPANGPIGPAFVCCGVRTDALSMSGAVSRILSFARQRGGRAIHLCNAYTLALARNQPALTAALNRSDLNLPDGMPLVWIGRRLGFEHMRRRVYGPDLMLAVMDRGRSQAVRHFLFGSSPEVVSQLALKLRQRFPGLLIVGVESPPFRRLQPQEETELCARVQRSGAQIMWVGLGTPYQDEFVDRFRDRLDLTLIAIGAAFDFHAGKKRQAPVWMREHGLEWVFRFATEPRRLWRRYLVGNTTFLVGLLRDGVSVI